MNKDIFLTFLSFAHVWFLSAQNISGVINIYTPVTSIGNCNLGVQSSAGFSVGDKVLVIQMKGTTIDITNTAAFGTILNYNDCGNYEFNTVAGITGNSIILQYTLLKTYTIPGLVQLIRIPVYNNATITGTLNAQPWNGSTGGVLVFIDLGNTTFNADVDVRGAGFRGTPSQTTGWNSCSVNYIEPQSGIEALKGEGIAILGPTHTKGAGSPANGGGGGVTDNGGGGASNFGSGGIGGQDGWQPTICGFEAQGGKPLTYSNVQNKIFMGGAGGDAQRSEGPGTNMGVSGAGIVIIRANTITGNNRNIFAQGNGAPVTAQDGGGGGGAGGTILIECSNYAGTLNINTSGGKGGDANVYTPVKCSGGGGGGGGVLWVSSATVQANIIYVSAGGQLGLSQPPAIDGVPGQTGGTVTNLVIPESTTPTIPVITAFTGIATICSGGTTTLSASGGTTYTWSTGTTGSSIIVSPSATTTYSVTVSNGFCSDKASVTVTVLPQPIVAISGNTVICTGDNTTFTATGGGTYSWNTGAITSSITVNPTITTSYTVTATNSIGCSNTASVTVTVSPVPVASAWGTTICSGQSATLSASGGSTYLWSTGATASSTFIPSVASTATYSVLVFIGTCKDTANAMVVVNINPTTTASSSNVLCSGGNNGTASIEAAGGTLPYTYLWNPTAATVATVTGLSEGAYTVIVIDANGCSSTQTVTINPSGNSGELYLPNAFSPNRDGENDEFCLQGDIDLCIKELLITIYNRWGEVVYKSTDKAFCWDATYKGKLQNTAVFVYYLDATFVSGTTITQKGNVSLIR